MMQIYNQRLKVVSRTTIDFDRVNGLLTLSIIEDLFPFLLTNGQISAAAFAWKIKEDLLPNSTTVSDLKLRVGYGIGQQEIGNTMTFCNNTIYRW
jgi:iron complex outermembrane receptor protein